MGCSSSALPSQGCPRRRFGRPAGHPTGRPLVLHCPALATRVERPRRCSSRCVADPIVESRHRGHIVQVNAKGAVEWGDRRSRPTRVVALRGQAVRTGRSRRCRRCRRLQPDRPGAGGHGRLAHRRGRPRQDASGHPAARRPDTVAAGVWLDRAPRSIRSPPRDSRVTARRPASFATSAPVSTLASLLLSRLQGLDAARLLAPRAPEPGRGPRRQWRASSAPSRRRLSPRSTHAASSPMRSRWPRSRARSRCWRTRQPLPTLRASPLAPSLTRIRDAMIAAPEMVGGTRDSSDTQLMRTLPRKVVVKGGAEGLRGVGIFAGVRGAESGASGLALKIEDGNLNGRANRAATVEALSQLGVLDAAGTRATWRYASPAHARSARASRSARRSRSSSWRRFPSSADDGGGRLMAAGLRPVPRPRRTTRCHRRRDQGGPPQAGQALPSRHCKAAITTDS